MSFRHEALKLVTDNGYKKLVEVGVWEGELSRMFYEITPCLLLVDPWSVEGNHHFRPDGYEYLCTMGGKEKTQQELNRMYMNVIISCPLAIVLRMVSLEAAELARDDYYDFVYIDSIHTYEYCKQEIAAWLPKIKPGGMIAGDDYVKEHNAVSRAVDEAFGPQPNNRTWSVKV